MLSLNCASQVGLSSWSSPQSPSVSTFIAATDCSPQPRKTVTATIHPADVEVRRYVDGRPCVSDASERGGEADNVGQVGQLHVTRPTTGPVHGVPAGPGTGRGRGRSGPPDPSRSLAASREVAAGVGGARNSQYFTVRPSVTTVQQNRYATRTKHFLARTKRCPARAERYAGAKNIPESGRTR